MDENRQEIIEREAAKVFDCETSNLRYFSEADPFNKGQVLEGAICLIQDKRYGALYLTHIDNKYKPQLIYATPKLHYPFITNQKEQRVYSFPPCCKVQFREKLDGTNILAYSYTNGKEMFVSYKTRLTPTLKETSRFGNWIKLWGAMLQKYPHIPDGVKEYQQNISFELYGKVNPHLISYETDLDVAMLFRVTKDGKILSPLDSVCQTPVAKILESCSPEHLVRTYERLREELDQRNKASMAAQQGYQFEGCVLNLWYDMYQDRELYGDIALFKLKPEQIEEIHFAAGGGLSKELVTQACYKALEADVELNLTNVKMELERDFDPRIVDSFHNEILGVIQEVEGYLIFKEQVLVKYEELKLDVTKDKGGTMRALSPFFKKQQMTQVFNILQGAKS